MNIVKAPVSMIHENPWLICSGYVHIGWALIPPQCSMVIHPLFSQSFLNKPRPCLNGQGKTLMVVNVGPEVHRWEKIHGMLMLGQGQMVTS